ncbi:Histone-Lysine N-Methyltransferase ash1l [Linnemannia zychae]|nr:Histone-Lysine N-Methyltransferase ash1l [Linnemannia zychae]
MSSNAARQVPVKSETKRSKRQLNNNERKSRQQRENIENTLASLTLPNHPIQKHSTQTRKRLHTEYQYNASFTPGDRLSSKRQKLHDNPRRDSTALSSAPPLHRTLSDKSSYLNQAPLHELSPDAKSILSPAIWKHASQLRRITSDSDTDADADDEDDPLQKIVSATKLRTLSHIITMPVKDDTDSSPSHKSSIQSSHATSNRFVQNASPSTDQPFPSDDDELFGSDITLTSPEDDSDDNIAPLFHSTTKIRHPQIKNEVSFSIKTRSKRVTSTLFPQGDGGIHIDDRDISSTIESRLLPHTKCLNDSPISELTASVSLMTRILDGRNLSAADSEQNEEDSSDEEQLAISTMMASLHPNFQENFTIPSVPSDGAVPNATKVETLLKDIYTSVCPPRTDQQTLIPAATIALTPKDHVFAIPTLPVLRPIRIHTTSRSKILKSTDSLERSNTKQITPQQPSHSMPRPRLFQTCREIMSQTESDGHRSNIQSISLILKHSLQQGMRKIQDVVAEAKVKSENNTESKIESINMQAWRAVIGNGKGLFHESPRKQQEIERIIERRSIVEETYRALDFPPPPSGWDKSSIIISDNLTPEKSPARTRSIAEKRWPSELDNSLGCDYCRKTYPNKTSLTIHMERCPMAQLQTSIAIDLDGDSTASETEDQRMARSPTALLEKKSGIKIMDDISENDNDVDNNEEDEENDNNDEEGIIMCICGYKEDEGAMVQCDKCKVWLHLDCLDLVEDDVAEEYFCPTCQGLPTPSTGGKSFRHIPVRASERPRSRTKAGRPRRQTESQRALTVKGNRRAPRPKSIPHWMQIRRDTKVVSGSDSDDIYSTGSDEDENQQKQDGIGSPQVTLNHDWRSVGQGSGSILGYDSEYMNTLFGNTPVAFKKSRAPALMLYRPPGQDLQEEQASNLISTEIGLNDHEATIFPGVGSRGAISRDRYSSNSIFDQGYLGTDSGPSSQNLGSDDTVDSDGLRTPIDNWCDSDQRDQWTSNNFSVIDPANVAQLELENSAVLRAEYKRDDLTIKPEYYPELLTNNVLDWYCDQDHLRADNFDINGLIDLEAVSIPEES